MRAKVTAITQSYMAAGDTFGRRTPDAPAAAAAAAADRVLNRGFAQP